MRKGILFLVSALIISSVSFSPSIAAVLPSSASTPVPATEPDPAAIKAAMNEFKALSKKEKKSRLKEARKAIREFKKEKRNGMDPSTETLLLVIIALFIPPLAVYLHQGDTNKKFWITTLLFVLGLIGAFLLSWAFMLASIVYALIVILGNG